MKKKSLLIYTIIFSLLSFIIINSNFLLSYSFEYIHNNSWENKRWITLGDSITKAGGYQKNLLETLKFSKIDNKGINGQTMAHQNKNISTWDLGKNIDYKDYDLVTIFIGTNDFRYHKPLGKIKSINSDTFDDKTFIGAYQLLLNKIKSSNPHIKIVLITPIQRDKDGFDIHHFNEENNQLIDYVNAIKKLAYLYSLPVIDLYAESGIASDNLQFYTKDGLHPNEQGYKIISTKIKVFLLNYNFLNNKKD